MTARWYVVNVYSGSEKKVAESIREQAVLKKMDDRILEVLVPTEQVVEVRKGTKVNAEHKFFPGYILVKMEMSDDTWQYKGFIYNVSDYSDINDLYILSDVIITDYSSVFMDFVYMKKPVVFYQFDLLNLS